MTAGDVLMEDPAGCGCKIIEASEMCRCCSRPKQAFIACSRHGTQFHSRAMSDRVAAEARMDYLFQQLMEAERHR